MLILVDLAAQKGLSQILIRFTFACQVMGGALTFCHVLINFFNVYCFANSSMIKHGRLVMFESVCVHGILQ